MRLSVIYIDSVFTLNAVTDLFLILITARLAGICPWRKEYFFAALAGGIYAAAAQLPDFAFLQEAVVQCAAGIGLALLAFGRENHLGRLTVLFFTVSCGFAGCVLALKLLPGHLTGYGGEMFSVPDYNRYTSGGWMNPDIGILFTAAVLVWLILAAGFRTAAEHYAAGQILRVRVDCGGGSVDLSALRDSGNTLRDAGQSVLVIAPGSLDTLFSADVRRLLTPEHLRTPAEILEPLLHLRPELRPRLMPYHTVGKTSGLLLSVQSECVRINGREYAHLRLALSPDELGTTYQALWGGEL